MSPDFAFGQIRYNCSLYRYGTLMYETGDRIAGDNECISTYNNYTRIRIKLMFCTYTHIYITLPFCN